MGFAIIRDQDYTVLAFYAQAQRERARNNHVPYALYAHYRSSKKDDSVADGSVLSAPPGGLTGRQALHADRIAAACCRAAGALLLPMALLLLLPVAFADGVY